MATIVLRRSVRRAVIAVLSLSLLLSWSPQPGAAQSGNCAAAPVEIAVGQNLEGMLEATDCISSTTGLPYDEYVFQAVAGRHYTVGFNTFRLFATLTILDPSGAVAAQGTSIGFYRSRASFQATASGTYTIVGSGTGSPTGVPTGYQVWVRDDDTPCDGAVTPIAPDETLAGALRVTDCTSTQMSGAFADVYSFTAAVGGEYTIRMAATELDSFLVLKNANNSVITTSNSGGTIHDSVIVFRPPATGTYLVEATAYDLTSRSRDGLGNYTISLAAYFCASQHSEIAPGQTLSGTLSETDCPSPHRPQFFDHYKDTFSFAATAGATYEIRLEAAEYDPYLYLLDASGAVVAENNDGGGGWNSRIVFTAPATGTYTIEATSYYYLQTGPYTVSLAVSAPCTSTNGAISPGETLHGELAFTDCYRPSRPDTFYDRYAFAATVGVEYTIALESPGFYHFIELRDAAGRILRYGNSTYLSNTTVFNFTPYFDGVYTLEVSSVYASATGGYDLTLLANGNSGCVPSSTPIARGETLPGALAITDCYGTLRDHAFHDGYTFTGSAGEEVTITMRSTALDAYVGLYGPDGAIVAFDDDGAYDGGQTLLDAKLEVVLPAAGEYTIEATSYWATTTGDYTIALASGIEHCEFAVAPIDVGETLEGELDPADCPATRPYAIADRYSFTTEPGTTYVLRMSCPTFSIDPALELYDSTGALVASDDDSGPGLDAKIVYTAETTDLVLVEAGDGPYGSRFGPYTISLSLYGEDGTCVPPATPITSDESVFEPAFGNLTFGDCYSPNRLYCFHDRYTLQATAGTRYHLLMDSSSFDTWLILIDPDGNVVEQDDEGGGNGNAAIDFVAAVDGVYTLEATSYLPEQLGGYAIYTSVVPPSERGGCARAPLKIAPGQRLQNSLTTLDCEAPERPGSLGDRYTLDALAGAHYAITLASNRFDAYLFVVDAAGNVVAENNDSSGKLDATIDFVAPATGLYTIVATSNQPNKLGRYEVAVVGRQADTLGIYVPATGAWFLRESNTPGPADIVFQYGAGGAGLVALAGDWNGDGSVTAGLYDPATGAFFLRNAHGPGPADAVFQFGAGGAGILPLVGDWNGDGTDTVGLYATATGAFFLRNENAPGPADSVFSFGAGGAGVLPLAGDWNGDGRDSIGIYVSTSGAFFLRDGGGGGPADHVFTFGAGGAAPVSGDWNADGVDTVGLYTPAAGAFLLRNAHASGAADAVVGYGPANAHPVVGVWRGR